MAELKFRVMASVKGSELILQDDWRFGQRAYDEVRQALLDQMTDVNTVMCFPEIVGVQNETYIRMSEIGRVWLETITVE